jgi:hypothetical protein
VSRNYVLFSAESMYVASGLEFSNCAVTDTFSKLISVTKVLKFCAVDDK